LQQPRCTLAKPVWSCRKRIVDVITANNEK
jgi:hypothetical protein